jgi:hypothetical protein
MGGRGRAVEMSTPPRASSDRARHGTRGGAAAKLLGSVRTPPPYPRSLSAPGLVFPCPADRLQERGVVAHVSRRRNLSHQEWLGDFRLDLDPSLFPLVWSVVSSCCGIFPSHLSMNPFRVAFWRILV